MTTAKEVEQRLNSHEELCAERYANIHARESTAVSKGTAREVEASLSSIRSEVNAAISGVNDKMKALQKATTNRLDIN
jgi:hypothetical protein